MTAAGIEQHMKISGNVQVEALKIKTVTANQNYKLANDCWATKSSR